MFASVGSPPGNSSLPASPGQCPASLRVLCSHQRHPGFVSPRIVSVSIESHHHPPSLSSLKTDIILDISLPRPQCQLSAQKALINDLSRQPTAKSCQHCLLTVFSPLSLFPIPAVTALGRALSCSRLHAPARPHALGPGQCSGHVLISAPHLVSPIPSPVLLHVPQALLGS